MRKGNATSGEDVGAIRKRSVVLPDSATAAGAARAVVESLLLEHGVNPEDDNAYTAKLLASELAANAFQHARGGALARRHFRLEASVSGSTLRVRVTDTDSTVPAPRVADLWQTSGRGLRLVQALAKEWGVLPTPAGKAVWFVLDLAG